MYRFMNEAKTTVWSIDEERMIDKYEFVDGELQVRTEWKELIEPMLDKVLSDTGDT